MCFFSSIPYEEKKAIENSGNSELNKEKYKDSELKCMEGMLTKKSSLALNIWKFTGPRYSVPDPALDSKRHKKPTRKITQKPGMEPGSGSGFAKKESGTERRNHAPLLRIT
jgi:hypothetical protein